MKKQAMKNEKSTASTVGQSSGQRPTGNHLRSIGLESGRVSQGRGTSSIKERRARYGEIGAFDRVVGIAQLLIAIPAILITAIVIDFRRQ